MDQVLLHPPFRAEHIGSFLRPAALLKARAEHAAGRQTDAELRAAEDEAIGAFVALQEGLGFRIVTDGEFRRSTYTSNFTTEGLTRDQSAMRVFKLGRRQHGDERPTGAGEADPRG
jgi:5-methyltetrahydropteroyltriglutamate--homocysteine methyltransferase